MTCVNAHAVRIGNDRRVILRVEVFMRIGFVCLAVALAVGPFAASAQDGTGTGIQVPIPSAERGRFHFVSKGCVVCHSINGVGGKAGPALDATNGAQPIAPLDFAARMWRGAATMVMLQATEFGYQIEITGQEIADLAAFAADPELQAKFSENDIPEVMRGWTMDELIPPDDDELMDPDVDPDSEAN